MKGMKIGANLKEWGKGTMDTFINRPLEKKDYVGATMGSFAAAMSAVLEAPDYVIAGIADKELKPATGTRTGRDIREFGSDLAGGHLLKATVDVIRLPGSVAMDLIQTVGGFQNGTRRQIQGALSR